MPAAQPNCSCVRPRCSRIRATFAAKTACGVWALAAIRGSFATPQPSLPARLSYCPGVSRDLCLAHRKERQLIRTLALFTAVIVGLALVFASGGCGQETADEHMQKLRQEYKAAEAQQHEAERDL